MPEQDAISLLKSDHKKVKALLEELEKTTERGAKKRQKLLGQIEQELMVHTNIEETIFYPAFRDAVAKREDREMYFEALEEHHVVKLVLPELKSTDPTSEPFAAKAKVLKELVTHHAKEEERDMFPEAKKVLDKEKLQDLGTRMQAKKKELLARK
jgi:hemerythrin superfamily protein